MVGCLNNVWKHGRFLDLFGNLLLEGDKYIFWKKSLQNGEYLPQKNGSWTMKNFWYMLVFINHTWPNKNLLHVIINFFNHQWKLRYINCLQHSCYNKKKKTNKKIPHLFLSKKNHQEKKLVATWKEKFFGTISSKWLCVSLKLLVQTIYNALLNLNMLMLMLVYLHVYL